MFHKDITMQKYSIEIPFNTRTTRQFKLLLDYYICASILIFASASNLWLSLYSVSRTSHSLILCFTQNSKTVQTIKKAEKPSGANVLFFESSWTFNLGNQISTSLCLILSRQWDRPPLPLSPCLFLSILERNFAMQTPRSFRLCPKLFGPLLYLNWTNQTLLYCESHHGCHSFLSLFFSLDVFL